MPETHTTIALPVLGVSAVLDALESCFLGFLADFDVPKSKFVQSDKAQVAHIVDYLFCAYGKAAKSTPPVHHAQPVF